MNIPEVAVRAAEAAAHEAAVMWKWSELDHHESHEFFTAILEGAAPHMRAAWEAEREQEEQDRDLQDKADEARREWLDDKEDEQ